MLDIEKLDSLFKELDKFIDNNYKIPPADFNLLHDEPKKLKDLDTYIESNLKLNPKEGHKPFIEILETKRESLNLQKSELCIPALITEAYYQNLVRGTKPSKYRLISIGFALIGKALEDIRDDHNKKSKEIMEELINAKDINYTLEEYNLYDVILKFCYENGIFDIIDIDFLLNKKDLTRLSEILLKNIKEGEKKKSSPKKMIKQLLEKIESENKNLKNCERQKNRIEYYKSKYGLS